MLTSKENKCQIPCFQSHLSYGNLAVKKQDPIVIKRCVLYVIVSRFKNLIVWIFFTATVRAIKKLLALFEIQSSESQICHHCHKWQSSQYTEIVMRRQHKPREQRRTSQYCYCYQNITKKSVNINQRGTKVCNSR